MKFNKYVIIIIVVVVIGLIVALAFFSIKIQKPTGSNTPTQTEKSIAQTDKVGVFENYKYNPQEPSTSKDIF